MNIEAPAYPGLSLKVWFSLKLILKSPLAVTDFNISDDTPLNCKQITLASFSFDMQAPIFLYISFKITNEERGSHTKKRIT